MRSATNPGRPRCSRAWAISRGGWVSTRRSVPPLRAETPAWELRPGRREPECLQLRLQLLALAVGGQTPLLAGIEETARGGDAARALGVAGGDGAQDLEFDPRKRNGVTAVVEERLPDKGHPPGHDLLADDVRVGTNLTLRMLVHPKAQEVEEIVEIDFPVRLGIGG